MARKVRSAAAQKAHDEVFGSIVAGMKEAISIAKGEADPSTYRVHFGEIDVKAVRKRTGLTQDGFANTYGFSTGSVRDWEQGRVMPDQAARAYLYVIGEQPDMVRKTLVQGTCAMISGSAPLLRKATRQPAGQKKQKRPPAFASERRRGFQ